MGMEFSFELRLGPLLIVIWLYDSFFNQGRNLRYVTFIIIHMSVACCSYPTMLLINKINVKLIVKQLVSL